MEKFQGRISVVEQNLIADIEKIMSNSQQKKASMEKTVEVIAQCKKFIEKSVHTDESKKTQLEKNHKEIIIPIYKIEIQKISLSDKGCNAEIKIKEILNKVNSESFSDHEKNEFNTFAAAKLSIRPFRKLIDDIYSNIIGLEDKCEQNTKVKKVLKP